MYDTQKRGRDRLVSIPCSSGRRTRGSWNLLCPPVWALSQSLVHQGGVLGGPSREPLCPNGSRGPVRKPPRKHLFLPSITHRHRPPDLPPSHGPHGLEPQYGNLPPKTALFEVSVLARSRPAAVPMLPPGSARKRLAGNIPSNPANRWGPKLRGCTGGSVCTMFHRSVRYYTYVMVPPCLSERA